MKNLVYLLFTMLVTLNVVGQEKVGENQNGKFVITENLGNLKAEWNELAKEEVTNYYIVAEKENSEVYYLLGTTESGMKLATNLIMKNNVFYSILDSNGNRSTCTCSGCRTIGCDPQWLETVWVCANPCLACRKTVTSTNGPKSLSFE